MYGELHHPLSVKALWHRQFRGKISIWLRFMFIEELKSSDKESLCESTEWF